jgi:glycosyltransferase involved in cell wall biosynthesis
MMYRTTIGIPTYNRAQWLSKAIDSALRQGPDVCVIVSDNASTDNTPDVVRGFSESGSRLVYIRQSSNRGGLANFQAVLAASNTPYFMWLGDDDWLDDGYESACVSLLESDPSYALVGGLARYYSNPVEAPIGEDILISLRQSDPADRVCGYYALVRENGIFYGLARRELWLRIGMQGTLGFDWTMCAAAAYAGKLETLQGVHVHRIVGGASSPAGLVKAHGLWGPGRRPEFHPLMLGGVIFRDITRLGLIGADMAVIDRVRLAFRASLAFLTARYGTLGSLPSRIRTHMALAAVAREELEIGAQLAARFDRARDVHGLAGGSQSDT